MIRQTKFFLWAKFSFVTVASMALLSSVSTGYLSAAEQLDPMDSWTAQEYAQYLVEKFADVKGQQVKVDANADKAIGLAAGREGIILVPAEDLKEGEEHADVHTEKGAGLACLFMSPRFNPVIDGKQISQDKLQSVKYTDDSGNEKLATCLLLAVRNVDGDDWRLYAYGKDAKPVLDAKFQVADEDSEGPIAMVAKEANDKSATLVLTLFGKYAANFKIGE